MRTDIESDINYQALLQCIEDVCKAHPTSPITSKIQECLYISNNKTEKSLRGEPQLALVAHAILRDTLLKRDFLRLLKKMNVFTAFYFIKACEHHTEEKNAGWRSELNGALFLFKEIYKLHSNEGDQDFKISSDSIWKYINGFEKKFPESLDNIKLEAKNTKTKEYLSFTADVPNIKAVFITAMYMYQNKINDTANPVTLFFSYGDAGKRRITRIALCSQKTSSLEGQLFLLEVALQSGRATKLATLNALLIHGFITTQEILHDNFHRYHESDNPSDAYRYEYTEKKCAEMTKKSTKYSSKTQDLLKLLDQKEEMKEYNIELIFSEITTPTTQPIAANPLKAEQPKPQEESSEPRRKYERGRLYI